MCIPFRTRQTSKMNENFSLEDIINTLSSVFFSSEQYNLSWGTWVVQPEDEISLADSSDGVLSHIREEYNCKTVMYSLDISVIVLFMELPPVELHFLLSLNCFRCLAHRSIASSWELSLALVSLNTGSPGSVRVLFTSDFKSKWNQILSESRHVRYNSSFKNILTIKPF